MKVHPSVKKNLIEYGVLLLGLGMLTGASILLNYFVNGFTDPPKTAFGWLVIVVMTFLIYPWGFILCTMPFVAWNAIEHIVKGTEWNKADMSDMEWG